MHERGHKVKGPLSRVFDLINAEKQSCTDKKPERKQNLDSELVTQLSNEPEQQDANTAANNTLDLVEPHDFL